MIAAVFGLYPNREQMFLQLLNTILVSAGLATSIAYFFVRRFFGGSLG